MILDNYKRKWFLQNSNTISITDLKKLGWRFSNISSSDTVSTNQYYGDAFVLKRYAGLEEDKFLNCTIEHGMDISDLQPFFPEICHINNVVITQSLNRKKIIENATGKTAVAIGPIIHYADKYYSDETLIKIKKKWKRTLLVFPFHSIDNSNNYYDIELLINEIEKQKKYFDTIVVSIFCMDLKSEYTKKFRKKGYTLVSCGYKFDKYFLDRQKTIISLSDAVMINHFVSAASYSIYLKKPIYYFDQNIKMECNWQSMVDANATSKILEEFKLIANDPHFGKANEQYEWGKYYFGFNEIKNHEEIKNILLDLHKGDGGSENN